MGTCKTVNWKRLARKGFKVKRNQNMVLFLRSWLPVVFPAHLGVYGRSGKGIEVGGYVADPCNKFHHPGKSADIYLSASRETDLKLGSGLFEMFADYPYSLGVEQVIWNRRLWLDGKDAPGCPRPFSPNAGMKAHDHHIHVTFTEESAIEWGSSTLMYLLSMIRSEIFGGK